MKTWLTHPTTWLALLALAFFALGLTYSLVTPAFEAPDEVGHFYYAVYLVTHRALPVQSIGALGEAHQPPLYYALVALFTLPADLNDPTGQFVGNPAFMWAGNDGNDVNIALHDPAAERFPWRGHALALHLARLASLLMGTATVVFTVLIGWQVFPDTPALGLLAGALVAFNPQFLFISGAVNNDNLLTLLSTLAWWQLLRLRHKPESWRVWAGIGALIGAGLLAKINGGLVIGAVAGLVLLIGAWERRSFRLLLTGAAIMALVALLISGWWFVRNQVLYGDPLGWEVYRQVFAVNLRATPLSLAELRKFLATQLRSFWGIFGWMNVSAPPVYYRFWKYFTLLGVVGVALRVVLSRFKRQGQRLPAWPLLAILAAIPVLQEAYMLAVITRCNESCYQGRYLFPAVSVIALALAWGLTAFVPQKYAPILAVGVGVGLAALALWVPFGVIAPAYGVLGLP